MIYRGKPDFFYRVGTGARTLDLQIHNLAR